MPGYRCGSVINHLRRDLSHLPCMPLSDSCADFQSADGAIAFRAEERVEPQFLMHVVNTEFSFRIPGTASGCSRLVIRHTGAWKRTGIECIAARDGDETTRALARRLSSDSGLAATLMPLDFSDFTLVQDANGWSARVVHFGACEVVYRVPPIRQYVRLPLSQADALIASFMVLADLLSSR